MKKVTLTIAQARLIEWATIAGLDQHSKFLLHDGWDNGMTKAQRYNGLKNYRKFNRAINTIQKALAITEQQAAIVGALRRLSR